MRGGELFEDFFADGGELGNDENGNIPTGVYKFKADEPIEYLPHMYDLIHGTFTTNPDATRGLGVDLGLPSGKLWAIQNVNATQPYFAGNFFSWGNAEGVDDSEASLITPESYQSTPGAALTGDIPLTHDAANHYFGNGWRMPTKEEFQELYENCEWTWKQVKGVYGYEVKSKTSDNTNSIFLPAAGFVYKGSLRDVNLDGYYWSSSYNNENSAFSIGFGDEGVAPGNSSIRNFGFTVRAIHDAV